LKYMNSIRSSTPSGSSSAVVLATWTEPPVAAGAPMTVRPSVSYRQRSLPSLASSAYSVPCVDATNTTSSLSVGDANVPASSSASHWYVPDAASSA
jgi:hypothetical protein